MGLDGNQYKIIVESAPNMLWRSGKDALCDYFNTTWLNFTGRTLEQEIGDGWTSGVHPDDLDRCMRIYLEAFKNQKLFEMIYRLRRHDGEYRWINDRGVPFFDNDGGFAGYIGSCIDINEQVTGESWKVMAQKDGLTGVFNRKHFEQEALQLFNDAQKASQVCCVVMLDIDNFKEYNDRYGHSFGDKILITFAGILKENIRDSDLLGRYGGDEFILLLPDTRYHGAVHIMNRIAARMVLPFDSPDGAGLRLLFSCGIAESEPGDTYNACVERADRSMYAEKRMKKQSVAGTDKDM